MIVAGMRIYRMLSERTIRYASAVNFILFFACNFLKREHIHMNTDPILNQYLRESGIYAQRLRLRNCTFIR